MTTKHLTGTFRQVRSASATTLGMLKAERNRHGKSQVGSRSLNMESGPDPAKHPTIVAEIMDYLTGIMGEDYARIWLEKAKKNVENKTSPARRFISAGNRDLSIDHGDALWMSAHKFTRNPYGSD